MPHTPPGLNAADLKVFEKARKGDAAALVCIQKMIRDRNWVNLLGDLGHEATVQLLSQVASDDPVWKVGLVEHLKELMAELLGENPSVLEKLLVRRVVNGWIVVHRLELEYSSLASNMVDTRDCLDKAISRAQRRYTESIHELARVRRLQAPKILAQAVPAEASREIGGPMIPKTPEEPTKSSEPVPPSIVNRIIDHGE